jgi:hypothetical protein
MGRSRPVIVCSVFQLSIFVYISRKWYKLQKYIENTILLKNMKENSIESLRVDIGVGPDKSHF